MTTKTEAYLELADIDNCLIRNTTLVDKEQEFKAIISSSASTSGG